MLDFRQIQTRGAPELASADPYENQPCSASSLPKHPLARYDGLQMVKFIKAARHMKHQNITRDVEYDILDTVLPEAEELKDTRSRC